MADLDTIIRASKLGEAGKQLFEGCTMDAVVSTLAVYAGMCMISQAPDRKTLDEWHEAFEQKLLTFLAKEGHMTQDHPLRAATIAAHRKARERGGHG